LHPTAAKLVHLGHSRSGANAAGLHESAETFATGLTATLFTASDTLVNPVYGMDLEAHAVVTTGVFARLDAEQNSGLVLSDTGENEESNVQIFVCRRYGREARLLGRFTLAFGLGRRLRRVLVCVLDLEIKH
jgi:hypothetical protein